MYLNVRGSSRLNVDICCGRPRAFEAPALQHNSLVIQLYLCLCINSSVFRSHNLHLRIYLISQSPHIALFLSFFRLFSFLFFSPPPPPPPPPPPISFINMKKKWDARVFRNKCKTKLCTSCCYRMSCIFFPPRSRVDNMF